MLIIYFRSIYTTFWNKRKPKYAKLTHSLLFILKIFSPLILDFMWSKKYKSTRKHSSRMCTAHLLTVSSSFPCILGGVCPKPPEADPMEAAHPLEADPLDPPGHMTCDACWKATPNRQTNTCENITLPQSSFAGGRNSTDVSLEHVFYVIRNEALDILVLSSKLHYFYTLY